MIPEAFLVRFRDSLIRGEYNLLLGSGICLDSINRLGETLRDANQLRLDLCTLIGVPDTTTLSKAAAMLNSNQREEQLVERYSGCRPGSSLSHLPRYIWRRLFTFNIDDVLESLYRASGYRKQILVPYNYNHSFEPTPQRDLLQGIHLHGWVNEPDVGFVFSANEYARNMRTNNPWMHMLSEILATEPFIIAGTSLNEPDLEYYLSFRNESTPQRGRGPSLLIEPYHTAVTEFDCQRFGLVLVKSDFSDFLAWLHREVPAPPSIAELVVPDVKQLFSDPPQSIDKLRFFTDFESIVAAELPTPESPPPFLYGREPEWSEINSHVDINRPDTDALLERIEEVYALDPIPDDKPRLILVLDEAGTGKTTTIKRVAHRFAALGRPVFSLRTLAPRCRVGVCRPLPAQDEVPARDRRLRRPRGADRRASCGPNAREQGHRDRVGAELPPGARRCHRVRRAARGLRTVPTRRRRAQANPSTLPGLRPRRRSDSHQAPRCLCAYLQERRRRRGRL